MTSWPQKSPGDRKVVIRRFILSTIFFAFIFIALQALYFAKDKASCAEAGGACFVPHLKGHTSNKNQGLVRVSDGAHGLGHGFPPLSTGYISEGLKPRYNFKSYEEYVNLQLRKTLNPKLRSLWTSKDWRRKVDVFSSVFQNLMNEGLLKPSDKVLCIAARVGQEVLALKEIGVVNAIGVDLVPSPPLVVKGDMHRLPFKENSFDFEFSNAFDHALFPALFASEVERTLKPGGILVLHLALKQRPDKYSANELSKVDPILYLFKNFEVVLSKDVDAFGLDLEVVLRKPSTQVIDNIEAGRCPSSGSKSQILARAEPLIMEEPLKPWITLKQNAENIKYLPSLMDISKFHGFVYIDVGARSYGSSVGSWFVKKYPKQNQKFSIYAVEADDAFAADYSRRKNVKLLPFAAWVRNESLVFGANPENRAAEGDIGMGRIQSRSAIDNSNSMLSLPSVSKFKNVQGFDFSEWLIKTVSVDDFVVLKLDIEGTEFDLLPRMLETGAICLVDELFLECHYNRWQRTSSLRTSKFTRTYSECVSLFQALRNSGVLVHQWW
ncbi:hypothetical protein GOP47_0024359 [Adiantum capillus-veneris]|uniref:Methyltransferase type 11 domain-containing protein n=1 Tax=Adiantum capillus-veneris TaxID=13818 RepID=A0A9D4U3X2_ADICA|nr:hypothetical protein GOP47_0024359 [Adiantum capillus-veneris]